MSDRANRKPKIIKIPGPDHPITIERNAHRVVVIVAGRAVADTRAALTLREASYPPVQYIPRKDGTLRCSRERTTPPTAPTRATAHTTAFRWAVCAPPLLSGPMNLLTRR